jgi:hypothetical protein
MLAGQMLAEITADNLPRFFAEPIAFGEACG